MGKKTYKPGEEVPKSGQYNTTGTGNELTGVEGKRLPPIPKPGQHYVLVDKTQHKK